ncbi:MAG: S26 family signal peptidase [Halobacteriales archaeon]
MSGRRGPLGWLRWLLRTDQPTVRFVREVASSVLAVTMVGLFLFAVSGVWPPLVAVESGSMEPHMHRGDLVFVMQEDRLAPPPGTDGTGIVPYRVANRTDYRKFGNYGDVIVYRPDGRGGTPIIHRARFWVNGSENWYDKAKPGLVPGSDCGDVPNCPAPHAGFITKGDNNGRYDQVSGISGPVRPEWIRGTAEVRIPWLGYVRLQFAAAR